MLVDSRTDGPARGGEVPVLAIACGRDARSAEECASLLEHVPDDLGYAYVISGASMVRLPRHARVQMVEATDRATLRPGHAYLAPPHAVTLLEGGRLSVLPPPAPHRPIHRLLRSVVAGRGSATRAAFLGATAAEVHAMREVRAAGGLAFATAPSTDPLDGGPAADLLLKPEDIPAALAQVEPGFPIRLSGEMERLGGLFVVLREATGADFSRRRTANVLDHVVRRMMLIGTRDLGAYIDRLDGEPRELEALQRDLRRRPTGFFRDPDLADQLLAALVARAPGTAHDPVRCWVVGCGTGEAAYSLAITAIEVLAELGRNVPVKILATDADDRLLDTSRIGTYPEAIDLDVSLARLERYFTPAGAGWQVRPAVRERCTFGRHDPLSDPPFSRLDLVWCRGVLRAFDPVAVGRILPRLHYGLAPSGRALFDRVDTIDEVLFEPVGPGVFLRRPAASTWAERLSGFPQDRVTDGDPRSDEAFRSGRVDLRVAAERALLDAFAPPSVVVDDQDRVLLFQGNVSRWLVLRPGAATLDLGAMLRPELQAEVRRLIAVARGTGEPAVGTATAVEIAPSPATARIRVAPVPLRASPCLLVTFEAQGVAPEAEPEAVAWASRVAQLEDQLLELRGGLGTILQQREHELDTAHEEIQSLGEEFQTTHADLVQAKGELQAINEVLRQRNTALAEINIELEGLLGAIELPIVTLDADLRVLRMASAAASVFSVRAPDVGRPFGHLRHSFDLDLEAVAREVIDTVRPVTREARDLSGRWWRVVVRPLGGGHAGVVVAAFDVDTLRRSLERAEEARSSAEALVEAMGRPLAVVDEELVLRRCNAAFAALVGVDAAAMVGATLAQIPWGPLAVVGEALGGIAAGPEDPCEVEVVVPEPDGGERFLQASSRAVAWPDATVVRPRLLSVEDVTERRRELERAHALTAERAARREAEAGSRAKDEYLAMLAHELRNPLAPLQTSLQILTRDPGGPPPAWALDIAWRQVRHLARLVDDLLDASRLARRKVAPRLQDVDLIDLVARSAAGLRSSFEAAELRFDVELPNGPAWVLADATRIDQVLVNLLTNAIKYSDPGGTVQLEVALSGGQVTLAVIDDGVGIDPALLPRIFDPFVQAEQRIDRERGGLGIGLTIVKELVELHGGVVEVHSAGVGHGSAFRVTLPLHDGFDREIPEDPGHEVTVLRRVLIVDDNRDAADAIAMLLQGSGHDVRVAYDGPAALRAVDEALPELVLLDLGLPGMDGFEVAAAIRARHGRGVKLCALTGYGDDAHRRRALEVGFDEHLVKPMDPAVLDRLVVDPLLAVSAD